MGLIDSLRAWIDSGTRRAAAAPAQPPAQAALDFPADDWRAELLLRIEQRVVRGHYPVPRLPAEHLYMTSLAGDPAVDIGALVDAIRRDPVLSRELPRIANSNQQATTIPAAAIEQALLSLGRSGLRSMSLAVSLRSLLLAPSDLVEHAGEVWHQSYSRARIAREIGPACGIDPERAFGIGLLQDVGKLPLLRLIREEVPEGRHADPALVERVLADWHEVVGARVAAEWSLSAELASVIAAHHDFRSCTDEPRLAAFARLVHRLDSMLALPGERDSGALLRGLEMDALGLQEAQRLELLRSARAAFEAAQRDPLVLGADPAPTVRARGADSNDLERAVA